MNMFLLHAVLMLALSPFGRAEEVQYYAPCITPDGKLLAVMALAPQFSSCGQAFVSGDGIHFQCISVSDTGSPADDHIIDGLRVSPNGQRMVFFSSAKNLPPLSAKYRGQNCFVYNTATGKLTMLKSTSPLDGRHLSPMGKRIGFFAQNTDFLVLANQQFVNTAQPATADYLSIVNVEDDQVIWEKMFPELLQPEAVTPDGRLLIYTSNVHDKGFQLFAYDRTNDTQAIISISPKGALANTQAEDTFGGVAVSADGRYVAFSTSAENVSKRDRNQHYDVFVRDRQKNMTTRISIGRRGKETNGDSGKEYVGMSADGRYIVFDSNASNLVEGDTNNCKDCFLYDNNTQTITLISRAPNGEQFSGYDKGIFRDTAISSDAKLIAFSSIDGRIYLYNRDLGKTAEFQIILEKYTIEDRIVGKFIVIGIVARCLSKQGMLSGKYLNDSFSFA
ncbi:MAG TPA: hypothetical protein VHV83_01630 [Armatimonadota bacterium]|nr:hypothetical protein [Armatimonadota bacterium]